MDHLAWGQWATGRPLGTPLIKRPLPIRGRSKPRRRRQQCLWASETWSEEAERRAMRTMRGSVEGGTCGLMGVPERKKTYKVRRMISLNRGLRPMKEAAWSRASRI